MENLANLISIIALIIAFLSYIKAKESLRHSEKIASENRMVEAEKERTDLLYMISEEKELVESLLSDVSGFKFVFEHEHQVVQTLLKNYTRIFEQIPKLTELLGKIESDYNAVLAMDPAAGPEQFLKLKAYQKDTSRDIRFAQKNTYGCISEFSQRILQAREYQQNAIR